MRKHRIFFGIFCVIFFLISFLFLLYQKPKNEEIGEQLPPSEEKENRQYRVEEMKDPILLEEKQEREFISPLNNPQERINKKPFGIWVDSQNSPIFPERFLGYHTGVDFEVFPGEENEDVEIRALCSGEIFFLEVVNGYGGVMLQRCFYEEQPIIVLYGHIDKDRTLFSLGDRVEVGMKLGFLGKGNSKETDGERKHLHLGVIKGDKENFLGYVRSEALLDNWIDPCDLICFL